MNVWYISISPSSIYRHSLIPYFDYCQWATIRMIMQVHVWCTDLNLFESLNLDLLNFQTCLSKINISSFNTRKSAKCLPCRICKVEWIRRLGIILNLFCLGVKQPAGYGGYILQNHGDISIWPISHLQELRTWNRHRALKAIPQTSHTQKVPGSR